MDVEEVRECHNVTGSYEYFLRVECADLPAYRVLKAHRLSTIAGIYKMETHVVMDSPKDTRV